MRWWWSLFVLSTCAACTSKDRPDGPGGGGGPTDPVDTYPSRDSLPISETSEPTCAWPHPIPPAISGGEIFLGSPGSIQVTSLAPYGEVTLYRSTAGQGIDDCETWDGLCLEVLDAQVYATGLADPSGAIVFELPAEDFTETGTHVWQAVVVDPTTGCPGATLPMSRYIAVAAEDNCCVMRYANAVAGLTNTFTSGNTHTGGSAWVDFNNDYWPDLFIVNGTNLPHHLYRNNGDGTFTNRSFKVAKPDESYESAGAKYADIDNDGDYDLMVAVDNPAPMVSSTPQPYEGGPNLLYLNNGDATFTEVGEAAGVVDPRGWRNSDSAFADYDLDGCIDMYVTNWAMAALPAGDNFDRMLKGNCDGTFTDVTAEMGADGHGRDGLVAFWWDANFDLFPDLYVGNNSDLDSPPDFEPRDVYYRNDGGEFMVDVTAQNPGFGDDARAAMGADVGDFDLDGDWDLVITDVVDLAPLPYGNVLAVGEPDGSLSDNLCQEHELCLGYKSWPVNFADFNRDMHPDLWLGTSQADDPEILLINRGDATFEAHLQSSMTGYVARGGSVADYDGDGDVDIFLWTEFGDSTLFQHFPTDTNHWMEFKLFGRFGTRDAIGSTVYVTAGGVTQMRRVSGGDSAHSQSDAILHFGMGSETVAERVEIIWATGTSTVLEDVPVDLLLFVDEATGLMAEQVYATEATWSDALDTVTVTFQTNFGGRSQASVPALGPELASWNADDKVYELSFPAVAVAPATVTIESVRGGTYEVPVEVVP